MRIIAGKYRGKKLNEFTLDSTKPTLDRVKESIFNLIQFDLVDAVILDLFSGTGALGIEALSRGAKKCVFVDNNELAINITNSNLQNIDRDSEVILSDYMDYLESCKQKFDIILLDPPYKTDYGIEAINTIITRDLLNDNGIIIFETTDEKTFELAYYGYKCKRKKYGTVAVYKIQKVNEND